MPETTQQSGALADYDLGTRPAVRQKLHQKYANDAPQAEVRGLLRLVVTRFTGN